MTEESVMAFARDQEVIRKALAMLERGLKKGDDPEKAMAIMLASLITDFINTEFEGRA